MSQLENLIQIQMEQSGIQYEPQKRMPFDLWPWRCPRSHQPKCDFYLPEGEIYVEVKGFMTIQAMAKLSWFCRQEEIRYYIFQGTEEDWNPYLDSPQNIMRDELPTSKKKIRDQNIAHQVQELSWLISNDPSKSSLLSLVRLKDYIRIRTEEYVEWNNEWY